MPSKKKASSKLTVNERVDKELYQIGYAVGSGAGIHISSSALNEMLSIIKPSLRHHFSQAPIAGAAPRAEEAQRSEHRFILAGFEAIGRLAAITATERGSIFIEREDLHSAYETVTSHYTEQPGDFCPVWP